MTHSCVHLLREPVTTFHAPVFTAGDKYSRKQLYYSLHSLLVGLPQFMRNIQFISFFPIVFSVHNVCVLFGLCILKCQPAFLSVNTDTRKHEKLQHLGHVSDALRYPGLHMHTLVWTKMRLLFDEAWVTHRPSLLTRIGTVISRL